MKLSLAHCALSLSALLSLTAAGCSGSTSTDSTPNPDAGISAVTILPTPCSVKVGQSVNETASITLSDGSKMDITTNSATTWTSSNNDTFTVNEGTVVGAGTGVGQLTVDYMGASGQIDCTVTNL